MADFHTDNSKPDRKATACKACKKAYFRGYYEANKEGICRSTKAYLKRRPEVAKRSKQAWSQNNRQRERAQSRRRHAERYATDIEYRLRFILRGHLRRCLIGRGGKAADAVRLRQRIEMNFRDGMSWDNYGEWHIDHRIPVVVMRARGRDPEQINCLANLRPMWATDNLSKGARFIS